jgi:GTP-binding protein EngB required for normal cell division
MDKGVANKGKSVMIRKIFIEKNLFKKDKREGRSRITTIDIYTLA